MQSFSCRVLQGTTLVPVQKNGKQLVTDWHPGTGNYSQDLLKISYHIISYHIISFLIISYHIVSYRIMSYHIKFWVNLKIFHSKAPNSGFISGYFGRNERSCNVRGFCELAIKGSRSGIPQKLQQQP